MNHSSAQARFSRPWLAVAVFLLLIAALVTPAQAARFYTPPSGKKQQYSQKRGYSDKRPFATRVTAIKYYPGRLNKPPKNSSPFRRQTTTGWAAKRR